MLFNISNSIMNELEKEGEKKEPEVKEEPNYIYNEKKDLNSFSLVNIIDQIHPEEDTLYFNDTESLDLYETVKLLMGDFIISNPKIITDPDFADIFDENIDELVKLHFEHDIFFTDEAEEELEDIIEQAKTDFFNEVIPPRSYPSSIILTSPLLDIDIDRLTKQINILRNKPQPVQRTKEWYEFRHNLITASNAYKAFDSQANKNQLIYEKCQPLNPNDYLDVESEKQKETKTETVATDANIKSIQITQISQKSTQTQMVNVNSTLHWGQKYEPLSVLIYEHMFKTTVEDFGCIQHETYDFLGASPDGINVDANSERYGRMLEIKNIVNREIDGIPKKEYWVQMQLQMEVCNLDECDFLETKFVEYENAEAFWEDGMTTNGMTTIKKGVIMYFHTKEGKPFYKYMPFDKVTFESVNVWQEQMIDLYQSSEYKYIWIKDCYWKLEYLSCVLVCRNRLWFQSNIAEMAEIWVTIVKERVSGFEHRAPNRKTKVENAFQIMTKPSGGCLLQFNKDSGKITIVREKEKEKDAVSVNPYLIDNLDI